VVKISKFNFNKEMESYIGKRRSGGSFLSKMLGDDTKSQERPETYKVDPKTGKSLDKSYNAPKGMPKEEYPTFNEDKPKEESFTEMEDEYDNKPGFFSRIVRIFTVSGPSQDDLDPALVDEEFEHSGTPSHEEVRQVLKTTVRWLRLIPPEDIADLKDTEDFKRYKDLLRKYDLIK
jgi:hypothetical protein